MNIVSTISLSTKLRCKVNVLLQNPTYKVEQYFGKPSFSKYRNYVWVKPTHFEYLTLYSISLTQNGYVSVCYFTISGF